ncbi:MAG: preprotein translocase subunit SecE [Deltaproteobacteria bacterium]|nr:preprotein translocase subunit SecE [Deltaproteobacteria bacterium]
MKKNNQKQKKAKTPKKVNPAVKKKEVADTNGKLSPDKTANSSKVSKSNPKKGIEKKSIHEFKVFRYLGIVRQFLKESRIELKKVKWPTRKELLVATGVVLILTLFVAFFLGIVDFGLIKIIKIIVG